MADDLIATPERRSYSTARNRLTALQESRLRSFEHATA